MRGSSETRGITASTGISRAPVHARAVGSYVPKLTRKAFEKFGFSTASLITDWATIVGPEVARWSVPERLKWPRHAGEGDEETGERRAPATLMLRVDPARALDIEYMALQLVERVNRYFGYRAIAGVRIVQAPLADFEMRTEAGPKRAARPREVIAPALADIGDERLRAALERLRSSIASGR